MELKKPMSLDEQIQQLVSHRMEIADKDHAKQVLSEVNYYRLSGYALQFREKGNSEYYVPGTEFMKVWRLHQFDSELHSLLKPYLDIVELYARKQIAYGFSMSKCQHPPHDQHYNSSNYYNKDSHNSIIIASLNREKLNNKDALFVVHHTEKYEGKMPLWVIVELLSFTNLSKLYSAMYYSEQDVIAKSMGATTRTLKNHLHCLANLRNKVAHAGRLYNAAYNPPAILGQRFLQRYPDIKSDTLFAYVLTLMRRLPNIENKSMLAVALINLVIQYSDCIQLHLLGFPPNYFQQLCGEIK